MSSSYNMLEDENNLISAATEGDWFEVLELYKKKELRMLKLSPTGDTALHMAASSGAVYIVERMLEYLDCEKRNNNIESDDHSLRGANENGDDELKRALREKNDNGNTALHSAASASKGSYQMCKKIGKADPSLITRSNNFGETPLFMAAIHGNKESFLWLHSRDGSALFYKRRSNDTILHCAIEGGHIDLAIEIILLYKQHLRNMIKRNNNGLSPLHLLAETPSAFESTDLPYRSDVAQLLYKFLSVEKKENPTSTGETKQQRDDHVPWRIDMLWVARIFDEAKYRLMRTNSFPKFVRLLIGYLLLGLLVSIPLTPLAAFVLLLRAGISWFRGIRKMKEKHTWTLQIMEELLKTPPEETKQFTEKNEAGLKIVDMPLMVAAKNGVKEMVKGILKDDRSLMNHVDDEGKNIVLLSAENRQTKLYQFLCGFGYIHNDAFRTVDKDGNTALHLAAKAGIILHWQTTTMVEEFKWFEFVKSSVPCELWEKYNKEGKTAEKIFRENYKENMTSDKQWLNQTSQTCSVASTLVSSMAFANIVAENFKNENIPSIVALSLSLTSTICFLAILAFRSQSLNFWRYVPFMLQLAIFTMFASIVALWTSLMLQGKSLTTYAILSTPIAILTIVSLPIFIGPALMSMFTKVPPRNRYITRAIRYQKPLEDNNNALEFGRN